MHRALLALTALIVAGGCQSFSEVTDAGPSDQHATDQAEPDHDSLPGDGPGPQDDAFPAGDLQQPPPNACRLIPLPCLDPAPADVIEVPTEVAAADAFAQTASGDTIQIKGKSLGSGWDVPAYVTLRGCAGAQIVGNIGFAGSGGTVEGFEVSGQVVANQTGAFTIRHNRFVGGGSAVHGVSARSIDALVSASVIAVVEGNWFEARTYGVQAATDYHTMTHEVTITIRNNIFTGVDYPVQISEGGMVGKITATIEHNTLYDFDTGFTLTGIDGVTTTRGNLLVQGTTAVQGGSVYEASYSALWQVGGVGDQPFGGSFTTADPLLVDPGGGDLRPGASSAVVDAIPTAATVPTDDFYGCPRPVALKGGASLGDMGAVELQP
jgi:hypothetical protein